MTIEYPTGSPAPADILNLSGSVPHCHGVTFGADEYTISLQVTADSAIVALVDAMRIVTRAVDADAVSLSAMKAIRKPVAVSLG